MFLTLSSKLCFSASTKEKLELEKGDRKEKYKEPSQERVMLIGYEIEILNLGRIG